MICGTIEQAVWIPDGCEDLHLHLRLIARDGPSGHRGLDSIELSLR